MNADRFAARLAEHGLTSREAERKRELAETVHRAFRALTGVAPAQAWWVPGRLEVLGKHTDYCGGHSLVGTIPRGFVFLVAPRPDGVVRVADARRGEQLVLAAGSAGAAEAADGWRRYAQVVVRRLTRNFPGASIGADVVFASDLPSASGMSSSSALVVGLVNVLVEAGGLRQRREWQGNVSGPEDEAGYYACFENGLAFGALAGDGGVGTHGGSEDHVAIVCSRANYLSTWQFVPISRTNTVAVPGEWTFVVGSSGVAAQKIGPAMEKYNSVSRRARTLLEIWNRSETPQPSLFAAVTSAGDAPDRLHALARGRDGSELEARLEQFLAEDRRVVEAADAFLRGDAPHLGRLSDASQRDAESLLGNQVPETIALARSARDLGALAASSFGAGFGGSVWALVDRAAAGEFARRWLDAYRDRFPMRTAATTFEAQPGPGLVKGL